MVSSPHAVLVLVASNEDDVVVAFAIVHDPGVEYPHVTLAQAWSGSINPPGLTHQIFSRIVAWAMTMEKTYIRAETNRSIDAIARRFEFEKVAEIIQFNLDPPHLAELTLSLERFDNG